MKTRFLISVLIFFYSYSGVACGNDYEEPTYTYTSINGKTSDLYYFNSEAYHFDHGFDTLDLKSRKARLEAKIKKSGSYKDKSDYALVLLKLGEKKKSLQILQELIKKYPDEYNVNANLGTAYELNGNADSALYYIKRAVKINPASHKGSEWIHIKILEAKVKMQKDPHYLKHHSILNLHLTDKVLNGNEPDTEELEKLLLIKKQLAWQLTERIAFVAPPDVVVADLLYDLANLVALTNFLEHSLLVYEQSLEYSPANIASVMETKSEVTNIIFRGKVKKYTVYTFVSLLIVAGIVFLIRKIRRRVKAKRLRKKLLIKSEYHEA